MARLAPAVALTAVVVGSKYFHYLLIVDHYKYREHDVGRYSVEMYLCV